MDAASKTSLEERIEGILEQMDKRLNHIETELRDFRSELRGEVAGLRSEISGVRSEVSSLFKWTVGLTLGMWVTVIMTLIPIMLKILGMI